MKAVRVREYGPPEVLRMEEAAAPGPAAGEVAAAVDVAGVTHGTRSPAPASTPFRCGMR
jgi:NADPH:quinone reductase